jgi:hypothetical protein
MAIYVPWAGRRYGDSKSVAGVGSLYLASDGDVKAGLRRRQAGPKIDARAMFLVGWAPGSTSYNLNDLVIGLLNEQAWPASYGRPSARRDRQWVACGF